MSWRIICDSEEVALECLHAGQAIGVACEPQVERRWAEGIRQWVARERPAREQPGPRVAFALVSPPALEALVELAHQARHADVALPLAIVDPSEEARLTRDACFDLGLSAVAEVAPLAAVLALLGAGAEAPWAASLRSLPDIDRKRIQAALPRSSDGKASGKLLRGEAGDLVWQGERGEVRLGHGRDAAAALAALAATERHGPRVVSSVEGVDAEAVTNVLFGPARALSDPTSKAALDPYGIPTPEEELCASPSRAAAEAARIGYPVRISLASPDLRIWDHPDLAVDMVDNAARVRDTFRQLLALAKARLPPDLRDAERRLLGVTVTATSEAIALLWVRALPLPHDRVGIDVGFADPHGAASRDCTRSVLPAEEAAIERALMRLTGSDLLFGGSPSRRKAHREGLADVLLRLCSFVQAHRREVQSVELRPLALLLDGTVEAREACVTVSDAFERSLESTG